ncbi:MAG: AAA family ATPase [Bacteroidales bacterium]|nr:AAA family ATPase [Bacteroidales bacterium]
MNYPIGIQTFEKIRTNDFAYVDKTALVYRLVKKGTCYFLSRPRRFGKSLLLSTLKAYFQGKKELFEGLAIAQLEKEWKQYPVLHLDLNAEQYSTAEALISTLNLSLLHWEKLYGIGEGEDTIAKRFQGVIVRAAQQSPEGKVVVLVDEYDKPLLEAIGNPGLQEEYRKILKAFYSNIKSCDEYIRFAILTGETMFSKLSFFSGLNNLWDISLDHHYAALCGFTQEEMETVFDKDINKFATKLKISREELLERLKKRYDGYCFSSDLSVKVYNPFSLICAMEKKSLDIFWCSTETLNFLADIVNRTDFLLDRLTTEEQTAEDLMAFGSMYISPIPLFFQSGYLTIKSYDPEFRTYSLDYPNTEVEQGFAQFMVSYYYGRRHASIT